MVSRKLRKIYQILFPKKISAEENFKNWLNLNFDLHSIENQNGNYLLKFKNLPIQLFTRGQQYSDVYVLDQVINKKEYEVACTLIQLNKTRNHSQPVVIIDAGANVGYTSLFFNFKFPNAQIVAVEPSEENAKYFSKNMEKNAVSNVKLYQKALSSSLSKKYTIDRNFRDGKDWSIATTESDKGEIDAITIDRILEENNLDFITLLKIDIEGAERFIFTKENDLSFLKRTQFLAIEIHDEFNIRESIYELLVEHNFFLFESGELTIGINKAMV